MIPKVVVEVKVRDEQLPWDILFLLFRWEF